MKDIYLLSLNHDLDILMEDIPLNLSREIPDSTEVYDNMYDLMIKYDHPKMISCTSQVEYKLYAGNKHLTIRLDGHAFWRSSRYEIDYCLNVYEDDTIIGRYSVEDLKMDKVSSVYR